MKWYKYCWITKDPGLCNPKTNGIFSDLESEENNFIEDEDFSVTSTTPCTTTTTEETTTEMTTEAVITEVPILALNPIENLDDSQVEFIFYLLISSHGHG